MIRKSWAWSNIIIALRTTIPIKLIIPNTQVILNICLKSDKGEDAYDSFDRIGDAYLPTAVPGVSVPLRQVSEIQGGWNEGQIVRRNGVRTLSVITG